jgi:hypothetical protein
MKKVGRIKCSYIPSFSYLKAKFYWMDQQQPTTNSNYTTAPAARGIFGTKTPSSIAFAVGVLLFLMPFAELKCTAKEKDRGEDGFSFNSSGIKVTNTGLGLAMGSNWKMKIGGLGSLGGGNDDMKDQKQKPNAFAIAALVLGIVGLGFCFVEGRSGVSMGIVAGILSAGALIALMFDLKSKAKKPMPDIGGGDGFLGDMDGVSFKLGFTPWYYIAVAAFLAGAYFAYQRMRSSKT